MSTKDTPGFVGSGAYYPAWHGERTGNNKPEPMPPTDSEQPAVWDLVLANKDIKISDRVRNDIRQRDAAGAAKYGTRLKLHNGRQASVDLYQELLDALVYAAQDYHESDESRFGDNTYWSSVERRRQRMIAVAELVTELSHDIPETES